MQLTADTTAALHKAAGSDAESRVRAQLQRDFPPDAMTWISDMTWRGPVLVPLTSLDYSRCRSWSAAKMPQKVASFAARMRHGWRKPVVLVKTPDGRLSPVDGHTRLLAARQIGQPVSAWIGTASSNHGPWEQAHAKQKAA